MRVVALSAAVAFSKSDYVRCIQVAPLFTPTVTRGDFNTTRDLPYSLRRGDRDSRWPDSDPQETFTFPNSRHLMKARAVTRDRVTGVGQKLH